MRRCPFAASPAGQACCASLLKLRRPLEEPPRTASFSLAARAPADRPHPSWTALAPLPQHSIAPPHDLWVLLATSVHPCVAIHLVSSRTRRIQDLSFLKIYLLIRSSWGKANRSRLTQNDTTGSKSHARVDYEMTKELGRPPHRDELFIKAHTPVVGRVPVTAVSTAVAGTLTSSARHCYGQQQWRAEDVSVSATVVFPHYIECYKP
ncbi:hypothetical protein GUJ93_ZPchr0004g38879 [Zizania palustris]|uniref:Uncharacterized protein n=1 Tax=Zizania palustris TaxID=103762 RepID=A0A8J5SC24_ZIZPA|nr:hypothetical protein GUJ93_ZPchr0004g38879 [Zizania palustris]